MNPPHPDSEEALELETIALFQQLGYTTANCYSEWISRVETFRRNVSTSWKNPTNNDFFLASQFWITGELYPRRPDLIGFINGIPLIFIELKASRERVELAYQDNFCDYRKEIPQLFRYNGFVILSNGSSSKIGSLTATWEYFSDWNQINSQGEKGIISLETVIRGTCDKTQLLDIVENFTLFSEEQGNLIKLVAKNHQYLGVNNCLEAVQNIRENQGKLGVFWHTQGSGKSFSMQFFSQKVHRTITGNWTFVIITDREDLDNQIYKNFAKTGAVTESEQKVRARSAEHLKQLLTEDHRYVFTLIQKFRTEKGEQYPQLSDRHNIIVIADEAHRSQYDSYAANMRSALPNAGFIGFTGTPLLAAEEATRREFGDYISIYNFRQSIADGATVPLFYENRTPKLELTNSELNEEIADAIESADLDEAEENKLDREFARELHLITREERLDEIAKDIVAHFLGRGYQGKAMVVSIDRFTAVKMYNKVKHYWQQYLTELQNQLIAANDTAQSESPKSPLIIPTLNESSPPLTAGTLQNEFSLLLKGGWGGSPGSKTTPNEQEQLTAQIQYIAETDMAVIISSSQNEEEIFNKKGLTIKPHRQRLAKEKPGLDEKFKDANHPLRIVFVCAMWMTGFDAPSCSTIYLDKPMRNHTLMQTIARANRVFGDKANGLIVDYIGVFRDLQKALAIYGSASGGDVSEGDTPVQSKAALVDELRSAIDLTLQFCTQRAIDFHKIQAATEAFARAKLWDDAVEAILINDDSKQRYLALTQNVNKLYKAILPDPASGEFNLSLYAFAEITKRIKQLTPQADIAEVKADVEEILDRSIDTSNYIIPASNPLIDLSQLDFEALKAQFASGGYKHTETEKLKGIISSQLTQMLRLNKSRMNYFDKFQQMVDEYNSGYCNVEILFAELVELAHALKIEDKRVLSENLSEEELAIFDLLTKPDITFTEEEKLQIKKVAKELLSTLKRERLVLDWRKRQQSKAAVKVAIQDTLEELPESYSQQVYDRKCQEIYQHVYESYSEAGRSIYTAAA